MQTSNLGVKLNRQIQSSLGEQLPENRMIENKLGQMMHSFAWVLLVLALIGQLASAASIDSMGQSKEQTDSNEDIAVWTRPVAHSGRLMWVPNGLVKFLQQGGAVPIEYQQNDKRANDFGGLGFMGKRSINLEPFYWRQSPDARGSPMSLRSSDLLTTDKRANDFGGLGFMGKRSINLEPFYWRPYQEARASSRGFRSEGPLEPMVLLG